MRDLSNAKITITTTPFEEIDLQELDARHLYLNGGVASTDMLIETTMYQDVFSSLIFHILRYNKEDKDLPVEERKPIILYINSPGGNVTDGFGLIDIILASKTPVYTVNQALCASMGFLIFLAGHKRFTMKNVQFLMHDGFSGTADSTNKAIDRMKFESDQIEPMVKEYVMSRTNIDDDLYEKQRRVEWWMLPVEAKKYDIVTDIVGEDCDIDEIL